MKVPTVKDRADSIYRKMILLTAAMRGAEKIHDRKDLLEAVDDLCSEAMCEAYIISQQKCASTPATDPAGEGFDGGAR